MFETILMPTDGSDVSLAAAPRAVELARRTGGKLVALYVQEPYPYAGIGEASAAGLNEHLAHGRQAASAAFERVRERASAAGVTLETAIQEGASVPEQIVEAARTLGADQIVIASHGRTGVAKVLLGSVAQKVLELSPVAVLVVKGTGH